MTSLTLATDPAISAPGSFVLARRRPDGTIIYVAPRPPSAFAKLVRRLGQQFDTLARVIGEAFFPALVKAAADMERSLIRIDALVNGDRNDPVRVAGLEARYYVRAAMDPSYATPEALHQMVGRLLAGDGDYDPDLARLAPESRRAVGVSAMVGWETRGERTTSWWCGDLCREGEAVGMQASCSPALRWRCEHCNPEEPPLVLHRLWGSTAVVVRCG
jgi:hypothetical protein